MCQHSFCASFINEIQICNALRYDQLSLSLFLKCFSLNGISTHDQPRQHNSFFLEDAFSEASPAPALLVPPGGCSDCHSSSKSRSCNSTGNSGPIRPSCCYSCYSCFKFHLLEVQTRCPGKLWRARRVSHRFPLLCFQVSKRERAPPVAPLRGGHGREC